MAAAAASVAAEAAAAASAAGAGVTTTVGAGAGAASSVLLQAARATAATMAAKTRDLFIFTILDELRKQFFSANYLHCQKKTRTKVQVMFD
ncbi:MAG: hypothetical protein M3R45_04580 [Pseudomonadota bacterium]|nr:hypothetical protein [Pseudomonadota bacterium]